MLKSCSLLGVRKKECDVYEYNKPRRNGCYIHNNTGQNTAGPETHISIGIDIAAVVPLPSSEALSALDPMMERILYAHRRGLGRPDASAFRIGLDNQTTSLLRSLAL